MYTYRFDNSINDSVNAIDESEKKKSKELNTLYEKLDNINEKFDTASKVVDLPENVGYERMENVTKTDDEIVSDAKKSLENYYNSTLQGIEDEATNKKETLNSNIDNIKSSVELDKQNIEKYYDNAKENASNEALKRGLSRSSIVMNTLDAFDKDMIEKYTSIDRELTNKIDAINFELNALDAQKKQALQNFDIAYATKVNDKIESLKSELQDRQDEVIKYNNEIAEKENEYNTNIAKLKQSAIDDAWDKDQELLDYATKNGMNALNKYKAETMYQTLKSYLDTIPSDKALYFVRNDKKVNNLFSDAYITKLIKEYTK